MPKLAVVAVLLGCAGCSAPFPTCISDGAPDAVGRWRYVGRLDHQDSAVTPAAEIDRPTELDLSADGRFSARFDPRPAAGNLLGPTVAVPSGEVTGRWQGGRFCAGALFMPWAQIATEPTLPNTASIQLSGSQLLILSGGPDHTDAAYERAGSAAAAAPTPLGP